MASAGLTSDLTLNVRKLNDGSRQAVTAIAESMGYCPVRTVEDMEFIAELYKESPSLRMIEKLRRISALRHDIDKLDFEIMKHSLESETKDITNAEILAARMDKVKSVIQHLESTICSRDLLMSRLRQPFTSESVKIELTNQKYMKEVLECIEPSITKLPAVLENFDKISHFNEKEDKRLLEILTEIAGVVGSQQSILEEIIKLRGSIHKIHSHHKSTSAL